MIKYILIVLIKTLIKKPKINFAKGVVLSFNVDARAT